jgi:hypothetical protein
VVRNLGFVHKLDKAAIPKICIAITCFISWHRKTEQSLNIVLKQCFLPRWQDADLLKCGYDSSKEILRVHKLEELGSGRRGVHLDAGSTPSYFSFSFSPCLSSSPFFLPLESPSWVFILNTIKLFSSCQRKAFKACELDLIAYLSSLPVSLFFLK